MIEDPDLTRRILEYFAWDDVGFPADKTVQDLVDMFPEADEPCLVYHVMCASQQDLLLATWSKAETLDGITYTIGFISGLSAKGGNCVRDARSKFWQKAIDKIKDAGLEVTTDRLCGLIPNLISSALQ